MKDISGPMIDETHAQALLELSEKLFEYGQFYRVLSLLDLLDWMSDPHEDAIALRIRALCKTGQFEEAVAYCLEGNATVNSAVLAEVYWGLGEMDMGDTGFRASVAANT